MKYDIDTIIDAKDNFKPFLINFFLILKFVIKSDNLILKILLESKTSKIRETKSNAFKEIKYIKIQSWFVLSIKKKMMKATEAVQIDTTSQKYFFKFISKKLLI